MQRNFSIGVLVNRHCTLQAWEVAMLRDCIKKGLVSKITVLVQTKQSVSIRKNISLRLFQKFENFWFSNEDDAAQKVFIRESSWVNEFTDADNLTVVASMQLDLIYSSVNSFFEEKYKSFAKYGLWQIVFGEREFFAFHIHAFWEVMHHSPVTGSYLVVYQKNVPPVDIYHCSTATVPYSVKNNFNSVAWKSSSFLAYRLSELAETGADIFFKRRRPLEVDGLSLLKQPGNLNMLFLFIRNGIRYLLYKLYGKKEKRFTIAFTNEYFDALEPDFSSFIKVALPPNSFYADPFLIEYRNKPYIFFENYAKEAGKGIISVLKPDKSIATVLHKEYHLSYPFLFKWQDSYYMIPETGDAGNVQLYRCKQFPEQWEFVKELLSDTVLIDATVFFHQNKWWMFGVTSQHPACSTNDQLLLFYTDDLLAGEWHSHPQNPVVTNIANCRPAGAVFEQNKKLFRPAQNNASFQYGYGICINEIEVLTETMYQEREVVQYLPGVSAPYQAIHTVNKGEMVTVIDAIV